jgi:sugar/nucleoside kinase (ribokinase family)
MCAARDALSVGRHQARRGAAGAEAVESARRWRVSAPKIEAIDTTGAGDAFVAAFLSQRLNGADN